MANEIIRSEATKRRVAHWKIAERYGVSEGHFCRLLRHELPDEEREKVLTIIKELEKEGKNHA